MASANNDIRLALALAVVKARQSETSSFQVGSLKRKIEDLEGMLRQYDQVLGGLGDYPSILQTLSPELQDSVAKRQKESSNATEHVSHQSEVMKSEDAKLVLFKHIQLVSSIRRLKDSAADAPSIWPSVTDERGWIPHVMRFSADLLAEFPVKVVGPEQAYVTEAIAFVKGVVQHEGKNSELSGPVSEFLSTVLNALLNPSNGPNSCSYLEAMEGVVLELAEEPFIGQLLLNLLTDELQKGFNVVHSDVWNSEAAIATERCGALLSLVFNTISCHLSRWASAHKLDNDVLAEWLITFHHLQQQIQREKSPLLLFALYTDKIASCIQDSIESIHTSSTPDRDLHGLLGMHCKLKSGALSNITGLLYSGTF